MTDVQTVHLIDDDASIRDALVLLLSLRGISVSAYESADVALEHMNTALRGCVISDLRMPGKDGLEFMRVMHERGIKVPIIMLTAHGDVATTRAALRGGAFDFLEKPIDEDILIDVIRHALDEDASQHNKRVEKDEKRERIASLTTRELQVMTLLGRGLQNREIAVSLSISPRTVEVYKSRMMEKLHCETIADVVKMSLILDAAI